MLRLPLLFLLSLATFAAEPVRVLFIGNSYTYYNNLPEIFASLARAAGTEVETGMVTVGGASLLDLWQHTAARQLIRGKHWDFVVLQEQSQLGVGLENGRVVVNGPALLQVGAHLFDSDIRKAGAKTVLMLTWSRRNSPEQQAHLNAAYTQTAKDMGAVVVPAGPAWQEARRRSPETELYMPDESHPAPPGSYLAACTLLYTLFPDVPGNTLPFSVQGHSSVDGMLDLSKTVTLASLPETTARLFQQIARTEARSPIATSRDSRSPAESHPTGKPAVADLTGDWSGDLSYFPQQATLDLHLRATDASCEGTASIRIAYTKTLYEAPVANCRIGEDGLQFTLATMPMPLLRDEFHGNLQDGRLSGEVRRKGATLLQDMHGTWALRRLPAR